MRHLSLAFILFILHAYSAFAQRSCATDAINLRWLDHHQPGIDALHALPQHPVDQRGGGAPVIPVVVHVVWNTAAENVAAPVIADMIATMNEDFQALNADFDDVRSVFSAVRGNADIRFCLASIDPNGNTTTGITRTQTTETWFDPENETNDMKSPPKGISPWDPERYLNIWICDISSGLPGNLITTGYAYLPFGGMVGSAIDGIVIDYDNGLEPGARTATHEAGHYLGLLHPWADGGCGSDDGMDDTPVTDEPTFNCNNEQLMNCNAITQYENFMDYADCSLLFTLDQAAQMNGILFDDRSALLTNNVCTPPSNGPCIPTSIIGTAEGDYVDGVQLADIANTASGSSTGASYQDYTSINTSLIRGEAYTLLITSGDYTSNILGAWIDLDQNDVFGTEEQIASSFTTSAFETQAFTFTIPANATLGNTVLRVRCVYPDDGEPTTAEPCANYTWGETEDYGILIETNVGLPAEVRLDAQVFPNPAHDQLTIELPEGGSTRLRIRDPQGRTIRDQVTFDKTVQLDVSSLASGQYLVWISHGHRSQLIRFVVLHEQ